MSFILFLLLLLPLFASSVLSDCCYSLDPTWLETSKYTLNLTVVDRAVALSAGSEYTAIVVFPSGYDVKTAPACAPVASSATPTYNCSGKGRKSLFVRFALDTTANGLTNENPSAAVTVNNEQCTLQGFCNEPTDPGTSTAVDDSVVNLGFGVYPKPAVIVAGCVGGLFIAGLCYLLVRQRSRSGGETDVSKRSARGVHRNVPSDAENQTGLIGTIQKRQKETVDGNIASSAPNEKGGGLVRPEKKSESGKKKKKVRDEEQKPPSDTESADPSQSGGVSLTRVRSRGRRPQASTRSVEPAAGDTMSTPNPSTLIGDTALQSSGSKARPTVRSVSSTGPSIRHNDSKKKTERADVETSAEGATTRKPSPASPTLDQFVVEKTSQPLASPRFAENPNQQMFVHASPASPTLNQLVAEKTSQPLPPPPFVENCDEQKIVRASATAFPGPTTLHAHSTPSHDEDDENVPLSVLADRDNDDENLPLAMFDERKPDLPSGNGEESDEDLPLISLVDSPVISRNQNDRQDLGGDDLDDQVPLSTLATSSHLGL